LIVFDVTDNAVLVELLSYQSSALKLSGLGYVRVVTRPESNWFDWQLLNLNIESRRAVFS
jgi:hypothetical protein